LYKTRKEAKSMYSETTMQIQYWGVRGSLPCPMTMQHIQAKHIALLQRIMQEKKKFPYSICEMQNYLQTLPRSIMGTYGGDTTCIEIQAKNTPLIILDAGTGIRHLGDNIIQRLNQQKKINPFSKKNVREIHIFFTHYHWDHLQGMPFFAPAYLLEPNIFTLHFYGRINEQVHVHKTLQTQQQSPYFPIPWENIPCKKYYHDVSESCQIGEVKITSASLTHPDSIYAYRFQIKDKAFVCATDTEYKIDTATFLQKFAENADILYHDAQYTPEEYIGEKNKPGKYGWGHSTYEHAIQNAIQANVKHLVLGHHDPRKDDFQLEQLYKNSLQYKQQFSQSIDKTLEITLAYQGLQQQL